MKYLFLAILLFFLAPALVLAQNGTPLASPDALAIFLKTYGLPAAQVYVTAWLTVLLVQRVKPLLEKWGLSADLMSQGRKVVLTVVSWGVGIGGFLFIDWFTDWANQLGPQKWVYVAGVIALSYKLYKEMGGSFTLSPTVELLEVQESDDQTL